jgi:hypothetical protein
MRAGKAQGTTERWVEGSRRGLEAKKEVRGKKKSPLLDRGLQVN